jgi:hypothetical protein
MIPNYYHYTKTITNFEKNDLLGNVLKKSQFYSLLFYVFSNSFHDW